MALAKATLSTQLAGISLTGSFDTAAAAVGDAFNEYMKGAVAGAVVINATTVAANSDVEDALANDLTGLEGVSSIAAFSSLMVTAIQDWWASAVAAPATYFATSTAIVAPTYATLSTTLQATLATNLISKKSQSDAMDAIAADIHNATFNLGTATLPGPTVTNIT